MAETIDLHDAAAVADLCHEAATVLRERPERHGCSVRLPARGRLLVTGDLHDNRPMLDAACALADLDADAGHHLLVQELIHGEQLVNDMDLSYRMLVRVAGLVVRYPGQVHPLLGNHEISQLTGRGVSKGAGDSTRLFNDGLDWVFAEDSDRVRAGLEAFLRALPLALFTSDGVACMHALPNERQMTWYDPGVVDRSLEEDDYLGPSGQAYMQCWGRVHGQEQVDGLCARWGVRFICIGHRHVEDGVDAPLERLLILNSDHARAKALPLALDAVPPTARAALGSVVPLVPPGLGDDAW